MALIKLGLTRDQLASFLQDFEQIKQFEKLFTTVDDNTNNEIPGIAINAGNAGEAANDALAQIAALAQLLALVDTAPRAELGTLSALQQADVPWFTFNIAPSPVPTSVGSVYWDGGTTLGVQMTANVLGRVNEDQFYYIKASAAITKGQVIMFDGAVGASGVVKGKPATGVTNGAYIMGIAAENIANNGFGLVQAFGSLRGINTSTYSDGDILWYNPAVTGGLTNVEPVAPNVKVQVAAVTNAANNGSIVIRVTAGSVLGGTDSNVQFGTLADGNLIQYDATAGYWKNVVNLDVKGLVSSTSPYGAFSALETAGGIGFRWTLANDGTYRLQRTTDGFSTVTTPILIDASSNTSINGTLTASTVYSTTVGATNRDLFIDNTGLVGYVPSIRASKTNITALDDLSWLYDLKPVSFNYRKRDEDGAYTNVPEETLEYGLIAEEVEAVNPNLVFYDDTDEGASLRGVSYSKLIVPMLREIQELRARIADLERK